MSTEINITIGDQRLLQESKTRAAANQQSLDSRLEEQQLAEQLTEAVDEATPEDPRSDAFSLQLDRRPAAQRRRDKQLQLDPIIIGSTRGPGYTDSVRVRTYSVTSGSEGVIYSVTPYFEAGLPEKSTGIIPGLKDSMLEAYRNYWNGGEVLNRPSTIIGTLADFNEFFAGLPNTGIKSITFTDVIEKKYVDFPRQYEDILVSAYVVDDILQLIFYRSSADAYRVTFNGTYGTTIGSVPITRSFTVASDEVASYETNCLVVTLNLVTKAVTKNTFTFHTFKTLRVLKSRRYFGGANSNLATVTGSFRVSYGYRNWREYEENIYTTEFLNFLSNVFPTTKIPFNVLPIFLGNFQQSYTYLYSDNPTEPRTSVLPLGGPSGGNYAPGLRVEFLNPSLNSLDFRGPALGTGKYHNMFSFLPYSNPLYAKNVSAVSDSYGFIDVPRWGSYDTRSGNRIVYGGPTAQPPSFSLLELEKVPFPKNAEELKKYSYPWPQSFVAYNQGTASVASAQSLFKLQALTSGTREAILSRPAPAFVATLRDLTAPSLPTAQRINAVNGAGIVFGASAFRYDSDFVRLYSRPSVLYHITKK